MTLVRWSLFKALAVLLFFVLPLQAQENPPPGQEATENGGLVRLFMDCQGSGCRDSDFFRTEIQFVNWVRDRRDSDVHLLITSQTTGAGGRAYDLFFIGQERFENMADTLTYFSEVNASSDDTRRGLASIIKICLMRYVGLTSAAWGSPPTRRWASTGQSPQVGRPRTGRQVSAFGPAITRASLTMVRYPL